MIGNILDNFPIWPAACKRFEDLIESLDTSFRACESAFLFEAGRSRQYNIGISARVAEEDVLHDKEVELGECVGDIVGIGVHDAHFLAHEIHGFELAAMDGFHHLVVVQSLGRRQLDLPTGLKSLAHFGIIHREWQHFGVIQQFED